MHLRLSVVVVLACVACAAPRTVTQESSVCDSAQLSQWASTPLALPKDVEAFLLCRHGGDAEAFSDAVESAQQKTCVLRKAAVTPEMIKTSPRVVAEINRTEEGAVVVVNSLDVLSEETRGSCTSYQEQAGSGGGRGFAGFFLKLCSAGGAETPGHYELTRDALLRVEPTWEEARVADLMGDASQDADFYEWGVPAAHAQTPNSPADSGTPGAPDLAEAAFIKWAAALIRRSAEECVSGRYAEAAYFAGYALHAFQDAATHQGRTNSEHSYNAKLGQNPDVNDEHLGLAAEVTEEALRRMKASVLAPCWARLGTEVIAHKMSQDWKKQNVRPKWDLSVGELQKYQALADIHEKAVADPGNADSLSVRWFSVGKGARRVFDRYFDETGIGPAARREAQDVPSGQ